jgi:glutaredoxin
VSEVTVFSRPGCHLCEVLLEELEPMCRASGVGVRVVNVDSDPAWQQRYGTRIPVVCAPTGEELSGWPFDRERVHHWLATR